MVPADHCRLLENDRSERRSEISIRPTRRDSASELRGNLRRLPLHGLDVANIPGNDIRLGGELPICLPGRVGRQHKLPAVTVALPEPEPSFVNAAGARLRVKRTGQSLSAWLCRLGGNWLRSCAIRQSER